MTHGSPRRPRGNAMIEFVLVAPLFLTIVLGVIDWGWYFSVREVAVNATRHAARVGSVAATHALAVSSAQAALSGYLTGSLGASYAAGLPTPVVEACPGITTFNCIKVTLTAYPAVPSRPASSMSGLIGWTHVPATLTVQSEMRLEVQP
jgi:Flp pilus assembly protein TadG